MANRAEEKTNYKGNNRFMTVYFGVKGKTPMQCTMWTQKAKNILKLTNLHIRGLQQQQQRSKASNEIDVCK